MDDEQQDESDDAPSDEDEDTVLDLDAALTDDDPDFEDRGQA
jgi:hypothetical protein